MLIRYGTTKEGKRVEIARIYTVDEHGISRSKIDPEARKVTERLTSEGFQAFIVGGAVRDLLVGKAPKDFDVATDAHPRRVRKMFWNSRIIGKRFRLVHVEINGTIVEVATFRSLAGPNEFGTIEEDVARRDFTMNALYYSPEKEQVLDYVGGFEDIRARRIRSLLPIETTFVDDPVRMVRAVKYAVGTGFELPAKLKTRIRKSADELARCSASRMTEEVFKILQSGRSASVFGLAMELGLFPHMMIAMSEQLKRTGQREKTAALLDSLSRLDEAMQREPEVARSRMIIALVEPSLVFPAELPRDRSLLVKEIFAGIKTLMKPITPPNADVEAAVKELMEKRGIAPPPKPRRRRRRGASRAGGAPRTPEQPPAR